MISHPTQEVRISTADPSAIGLFGLAMVTLVASSQKLGLTSGVSFVLPWAVFLGGFAQLFACIHDAKHNNTFGTTAFGAKLLRDVFRYERERRLLSNVSSVGDLAGVYDRHMVDSELTCGCQRAEFWQEIDSAQFGFYASVGEGRNLKPVTESGGRSTKME